MTRGIAEQDSLELKPCPFCGGDMQPRNALWPSDGDVDAIIHIGPSYCPLQVFSLDTADEGASVAKAWNERARQPQSGAADPSDLVCKWQEESHEWFKRDIAEIVEGFARWMLTRPEAADTLSQMRDALEVCRDKFAEYVRLHKAKLHDGTPTQEWLSIREKVTRNEDMVRLCDAALTTTKKEKDPAR